MQDSEELRLPDKAIEICNYGVATSECAKGSLCYVIRLKCDGRMEVLARSRSGRWIRKWDGRERFYNFRDKVIPPEHPRYDDPRLSGAFFKAQWRQGNNLQKMEGLSNAEAQAQRRENQEWLTR